MKIFHQLPCLVFIYTFNAMGMEKDMIKITDNHHAKLFCNKIVAYKVTENENCRFGYVHYDLLDKSFNTSIKTTTYEVHGNKPHYKESDLRPAKGILQLASIYKLGPYSHHTYLDLPSTQYPDIFMRSITKDEAKQLHQEFNTSNMLSYYDHDHVKNLVYNQAH